MLSIIRKNREPKERSGSTTSWHVDLESPLSISLEDLRSLIPEIEESLDGRLSSEVSSEINLDELRELLEPAGIITRQEVPAITRNYLNPQDRESKFRIWKVIPEESEEGQDDSQSSSTHPSYVSNLTETSEEECTLPSSPKVKFATNEEPQRASTGPESFIHKLEELSKGDNLEKWITTLQLPKELNLVQIRQEIKTFLKQKCWEKHSGFRFGVIDGTLSKRLWTWFKDLSIAKQIIVVIGLSVVVTAIGFLTTQALAMIWPGLLGVATSGEAALREIGVETFKIRQEPAFHLLHLHAEQARPFSYAWANQYVLWKYCR